MLRHFFTNETTTPVDALIDGVLEEMHAQGVDSPEYPKLLAYLERLHELKAKNRPEPVSKNTIVSTAGNLLGILVIVAYEQKHIMSQKGFSLINRSKTQ